MNMVMKPLNPLPFQKEKETIIAEEIRGSLVNIEILAVDQGINNQLPSSLSQSALSPHQRLSHSDTSTRIKVP